MIDMVGIGPFVVLPLVMQFFGDARFIYAWIAGALISFIDAFVWSELGTAFPKAGGSYNFLKEAYGEKYGKVMSFLYVWQTMIQAPLVIASGAIGFAMYTSYLMPLDEMQKKIVSGCVVIFLTFLLYRKIETIGKISVLLWAGVLVTFIWIIYGAISYENKIPVFDKIGSLKLDSVFAAALGMASVKTIYSYLGYYNVCHLGGEIKRPHVNIPRSIFISITGISILYILLNYSVASVISIEEAMKSEFVMSLYFEKLFGATAATIATVLILWIAFASLFAVMLGYSRVPYAAALDGQFFYPFSRLHSTKKFPYVSVLALGAAGFLFSLLFKLTDVISAILAMRILIQFIGQAFGVVLLRSRFSVAGLAFKMPLYPLPVICAIAVWLWIFFSTGQKFVLSGLSVIAVGLLVYYFKEGNPGVKPKS